MNLNETLLLPQLHLSMKLCITFKQQYTVLLASIHTWISDVTVIPCATKSRLKVLTEFLGILTRA